MGRLDLYMMTDAWFDKVAAALQEMKNAVRDGEQYIKKHSRKYDSPVALERIEKDAAEMVDGRVVSARRDAKAALDELRKEADIKRRRHVRSMGPRSGDEYLAFGEMRRAMKEKLGQLDPSEWVAEYEVIGDTKSGKLERHAFFLESRTRMQQELDRVTDAGDSTQRRRYASAERAVGDVSKVHFYDVAAAELHNKAMLDDWQKRIEEPRGKLDKMRYAVEMSGRFGVAPEYFLDPEPEPEPAFVEETGPGGFTESVLTADV